MPVEARPGHADESSWVGTGHGLAHRIKAYVGVTAGVDIVPPGTLERSVGKARRVIEPAEGLSVPSPYSAIIDD